MLVSPFDFQSDRFPDVRPRWKPRIAPHDLARLRVLRTPPNPVKIPLFVAPRWPLSWLAWSTPTVRGAGLPHRHRLPGMGTGHLAHDATHDVLFRHRGLGWAFGIVTMIPIFASSSPFAKTISEHHRYNRSPRDPDAFTMGRRGPPGISCCSTPTRWARC
ncbi:MAG: hypothetical protein IPM80_24365 [Proteobacteria bacterium]|nr:hypothetical protein [Pseudomonadota bacterium]